MLESMATSSAGDQEKAAMDAANAAKAAHQQNEQDKQSIHVQQQAQQVRQTEADQKAEVAKVVEQVLNGLGGPPVAEAEVNELKDKEDTAQSELDKQLALDREAAIAVQHASQLLDQAHQATAAEGGKVQQASTALQAAEEALASLPASVTTTQKQRVQDVIAAAKTTLAAAQADVAAISSQVQQFATQRSKLLLKESQGNDQLETVLRDVLNAEFSLKQVVTKLHTAQDAESESRAEVSHATSQEHLARVAAENAETVYEQAADSAIHAAAVYTAQKEGSQEVADALHQVASGTTDLVGLSDVADAKDEARQKYAALEEKIQEDSEATAKLKVAQEQFVVVQQQTQVEVTRVQHLTIELQSAEQALSSYPMASPSGVSDAEKQPLELELDRARKALDEGSAAMSRAQEAESKSKDAVDAAQTEEVNAKLMLKSVQSAYGKASKIAVHLAAVREAQQKSAGDSEIVDSAVDQRHQWKPIQQNTNGHLNRASSSLCLHSTGANEIGAPVGLFHCLYSSKAQQWDYSSDSKQLKVKQGLCAQAVGATRIVMATCNPSSTDQQFEFEHGWLKQKDTDLCIEGDSSEAGAWSRLAQCKSQVSQQWLYNRFGLDEHLLPGAQLVVSLAISGIDQGGFSTNVRNGLMKALEQLDQNVTLTDVGLTTAAANCQKRVLTEVRLVAKDVPAADEFKSALEQQMESDDGRAEFDSMLAAAIVPRPGEEPAALRVLLEGSIEVVPMPGPGSIDCKLSQWAVFAPCSKQCGGGSKTRVRTIVKPAVTGGEACEALTDTQQCNDLPCVEQACVVSQWSAFAECSKTCGTGEQKRQRRVMVQPKYGGPYCPNLEDSRPCHTYPCPSAALKSSTSQEVVMLGGDDDKTTADSI